ncbi:MAG: LacI family DNA-binding transcriptional regulator [Christensenella sp.]
MATTIKDIAKSLNISEATVSLALNNNPLVNVKTKERVLVAAKKLKYFPNMMAKGLATNKSNTIGIIVPDINIVFYANILRAVDAIVGKAGYSLLAAMSNNDPEAEESIIQAFISKRIEGVLAVPTNKPTKFLTSYQKALKDYNIPLVYITSLYTIEGLKYVMGDIMQGTYMLVNHLIDLGHSNIVFIGGSRAVPTTALRIEGYTKAFDERRIAVQEDNFIECDDIHYEQAVLATQVLIGKRRDFTAICAMNDEMALGVINTLQASGMRVPEDVSVVGYDNTIFSKVSMVGITSIDSDIEYTCTQSVDMLCKIINKEKLENANIMIKPTIIKRQSSGIVRK